VQRRQDRAESGLRGRIAAVVGLGAAFTLLIGGPFVVFTIATGRDVRLAAGLAVLPLVSSLIATIFLVRQRRSAREALRAHQTTVVEAYTQARAEWTRRRAAFDAREREEVDQLDEWGAARTPTGCRRFDVFGGDPWGWEGLLTIFGTSMLVEHRPVTVIDLSREQVCAELVGLAVQAGRSVEVHRLPTDLPRCGLLTGLSPAQLVDALVEAMHRGTPDDRAERSMDHRLLSEIGHALGADVSIARLVAALRVLMREPYDTALLRPEERDRVADELFGDDYRRDAQPNLRRIESYLYPLRTLGRPDEEARRELTCLALEPGGRNAGTELLTDLIVQWLINRVTDRAHPPGGVVVVVGADELAPVHLNRLADACIRRDVRLTNVFRHLRDDALRAIGGGAVGFMRLGNHEEAAAAADFVGREHRFVVSQLTRGLSGGHSQSEGDSVSRDWTRTVTVAEQSGWHEAESSSRVYEYTVEPRTFQGLPDYALVLVEHTTAGPVVRAAECDPGLVLLPRLSTDPLPEAPRRPAVDPDADPVVWRSDLLEGSRWGHRR